MEKKEEQNESDSDISTRALVVGAGVIVLFASIISIVSVDILIKHELLTMSISLAIGYLISKLDFAHLKKKKKKKKKKKYRGKK